MKLTKWKKASLLQEHPVREEVPALQRCVGEVSSILKPVLAGVLTLAFVAAPLAAFACKEGIQKGDSGDRTEQGTTRT